jgi:SNF2 family DNA or RNA helicase
LLLQLCSNPAAAVERYDETPAKLLALDQIVERIVVDRGEKLVIWSFYTGSIDNIMSRYGELGAVRYDGTIGSVDERRDAVTRFQNDRATRIFVANPAAAGAGLTLHSARYAIYESMSNQAAHYLQSLDRIHRRGQIRPVEYLVLLCAGTIEENEYQRLLDKEASAQALLGDNVDPPLKRTSMLHEAVVLLERITGEPLGDSIEMTDF